MAARAKIWWESKSIWIALIQLLIAILTVILNQLQNPEVTMAGLALAAKSIVDLWIRFKTNTSIKLK